MILAHCEREISALFGFPTVCARLGFVLQNKGARNLILEKKAHINNYAPGNASFSYIIQAFGDEAR